MKIENLFEANLYRVDPRWNDLTPSKFTVTGRTSRTSKGSTPLAAYMFQYACEILGIDCPRRWKSTFCTTDPKSSSYLMISKSTKLNTVRNLRKITVPTGTSLAYINDDFNMTSISGSWANAMERVQTVINRMRTVQSASDIVDVSDSVVGELSNVNMVQDDSKYESFKQWVEQIDAAAVANNLPSVTDLIKQSYAPTLTDIGEFGVVDSPRAIPKTTTGFEVWFEGDYEASRIK